jgi:hypothetical protein
LLTSPNWSFFVPTIPGKTNWFMKSFLSVQITLKGTIRFVIFLLLPLLSIAQPTIRYGNSYVNISKKIIGGVVEQGDTLEIRMTIHLTAGTAYSAR